MFEKLTGIIERYDEINQELLEVGDNYQRAAEISKERAELEPIVELANQYRQVEQRLEEARSILETEEDPEMRDLAEIEINELAPQIERLENELKSILLPKDPRDQRNVILEIRAGTGGDEAALFAADLFR
ncbi:MAG: PCRF domain-containing protein, partial [Chloroflexi bacterium]